MGGVESDDSDERKRDRQRELDKWKRKFRQSTSNVVELSKYFACISTTCIHGMRKFEATFDIIS